MGVPEAPLVSKACVVALRSENGCKEGGDNDEYS
jgi:hypothetical protein